MFIRVKNVEGVALFVTLYLLICTQMVVNYYCALIEHCVMSDIFRVVFLA